ncbi:hypothetical protein DFH27DRAFT_573999 [Peziza echinospora]|nr:hypothetical protein DFH27DRAFT_573999 [Peziza echinospora]
MPPPTTTKPKEKVKKPKKPYEFKKADLRLDEYKQEIRDRSPGLLLRSARDTLLTSRQFHLYIAIQCVAGYFGFGQIMVCIGEPKNVSLLETSAYTQRQTGILWMFYVNTGTRKDGEKSAYSVFNENFEA